MPLRVRSSAKAFTRIRDAVAALPVDSAVLDREAVLMRTEHHQFFEAVLTFHTDRLTS
jgi:hypothetical protein